jgi:hypothetical protein
VPLEGTVRTSFQVRPDCAVLVPTRPSRDLLALLAVLDLAAIWQEDDAFADSAEGRFT